MKNKQKKKPCFSLFLCRAAAFITVVAGGMIYMNDKHLEASGDLCRISVFRASMYELELTVGILLGTAFLFWLSERQESSGGTGR